MGASSLGPSILPTALAPSSLPLCISASLSLPLHVSVSPLLSCVLQLRTFSQVTFLSRFTQSSCPSCLPPPPFWTCPPQLASPLPTRPSCAVPRGRGYCLQGGWGPWPTLPHVAPSLLLTVRQFTGCLGLVHPKTQNEPGDRYFCVSAAARGGLPGADYGDQPNQPLWDQGGSTVRLRLSRAETVLWDGLAPPAPVVLPQHLTPDPAADRAPPGSGLGCAILGRSLASLSFLVCKVGMTAV